MRPTRWWWLVLVAVVTGTAAYAVTRSSYDDLPRPTIVGLVGIGLLAIAEFYFAVMTRARLKGRQGTKPIDPLVVARLVALAKASSVVGALAVGAYAGFLVWVVHLDSPAANHDTVTSAFGVGLALVLTGSALFLEGVCRVPKDDDEES